MQNGMASSKYTVSYVRQFHGSFKNFSGTLRADFFNRNPNQKLCVKYGSKYIYAFAAFTVSIFTNLKTSKFLENPLY